MSTSNNSVKGKLQWYYEQARDGAPDLQAVLLKKAGQQADDAFADNTTLAAVITAGNVEADFTGPNGGNYARKTIALPTVTVVNATDRLHLGGAAVGSALSITWTAAGGTASNELGRMLICYVPVPGTSPNSDIIWLTSHDISAITDGNDLVVTAHVDGFGRVRNP